MKPFRRNVALAMMWRNPRCDSHTCARFFGEIPNQPVHISFGWAAVHHRFDYLRGIAAGLSAAQLHQLYTSLGGSIFKKSWRTLFWPLTRFRYPHEPLVKALREHIGTRKLGDFWIADPPRMLLSRHTICLLLNLLIKPWKNEYKDWPAIWAILASCSVHLFFQLWMGATWMVESARTPIPAICGL